MVFFQIGTKFDVVIVLKYVIYRSMHKLNLQLFKIITYEKNNVYSNAVHKPVSCLLCRHTSRFGL